MGTRKPFAYAVAVFAIALELSFPSGLAAQRHDLTIDTDTDDGTFLQIATETKDPAKKLMLLERFTRQYPKHDSIAWVLETLQGVYIETNQPDKALDVTNRLLEADPEDIEGASIALNIAKSKNDPKLIASWTERVAAISKRLLNEGTVSAKETQTEVGLSERIQIAAQLHESEEIKLYNQAVGTPDGHQRLALLDQLLKRNPSPDLAQKAQLLYYFAYRDLGDAAGALNSAEKILARDQTREDILFFVANAYFRQKRNPTKVFSYCDRIVALMNQKHKPAYFTDSQWAGQKNLMFQQANFMAGSMHMNLGQFAEADRNLRAALPYARGNTALYPTILSYLGYVNYKMKVPLEAIKFYEECARIASPFQDQAAKSVVSIRQEYDLSK